MDAWRPVVLWFAGVLASGCGLLLDLDAPEGTSGPCVASEPCDVGNRCELGVVECTDGGRRCVPAGVAPPGTVCREARGPCDREETCDGATVVCPDDQQRGGDLCRPAATECDVEEHCSGSEDACAPDAFATLGESCASGICDGMGACVAECPAGAPCPTGNPCELGIVDCTDGVRCVTAGPAGGDVVCREANGDCDVPERCLAGSTACPDDVVEAAGMICREAAGPCDAIETCDGVGLDCPMDALLPEGMVCTGMPGTCDASGSCVGGTPCTPGALCATPLCEPGVVECSGGSPRCVPSGMMGLVGDYTPCDLCGGNWVCFGGYCMPYAMPIPRGTCPLFCCPSGCSDTACS